MSALVVHEIGHACLSGNGLLRRLSRELWQYDPDVPLAGAAIILAQMAGCCAERVVELGTDEAKSLLNSDPATFFETECASHEDLVVVRFDIDSCVNLAVKHDLIGQLSFALNEIGQLNFKAFARSMEATPVGDGLRLEGLPKVGLVH